MLFVVFSVIASEIVHIVLVVPAYSINVAHYVFAIVFLLFVIMLLIYLLLLPLLRMVHLLWLLLFVGARYGACCSFVVDGDIIHTAI
jgi:hypothetical protein